MNALKLIPRIVVIFRLFSDISSYWPKFRTHCTLHIALNCATCPKRQPKTEDTDMSESIQNDIDFASENKNDFSTSIVTSPTETRAHFSDTLIFLHSLHSYAFTVRFRRSERNPKNTISETIFICWTVSALVARSLGSFWTMTLKNKRSLIIGVLKIKYFLIFRECSERETFSKVRHRPYEPRCFLPSDSDWCFKIWCFHGTRHLSNTGDERSTLRHYPAMVIA